MAAHVAELYVEALRGLRVVGDGATLVDLNQDVMGFSSYFDARPVGFTDGVACNVDPVPGLSFEPVEEDIGDVVACFGDEGSILDGGAEVGVLPKSAITSESGADRLTCEVFCCACIGTGTDLIEGGVGGGGGVVVYRLPRALQRARGTGSG